MVGTYMDNTKATGAYAEAFRRLVRMSGFDHRNVLKAEAGSILKAWAGRTKVRTQAKTDHASRLHAVKSLGYTQAADRGDVTVNAGFRPAPFGRVWIKVRNTGGKKMFVLALGANFTAPSGSAVFNMFGTNPSPNTYKWIANVLDAVEDVQAKLQPSIEKGRRSAALARQSVVQIADSLGIDLARVNGGGLNAAGLIKARAALATTGVSHRNGSSAQGGNEVKAYVDLINRLPYGTKTGMDRVLAGVVIGRAKFIERAYAKGAFDNQKNLLTSFPNLFKVRYLNS